MKDQKLTNEQRKFAQEHHYVLENFLRYLFVADDVIVLLISEYTDLSLLI